MSLRVNLIITESNHLLYEKVESIPLRERAEFLRSLATAALLLAGSTDKPFVTHDVEPITTQTTTPSDFGGYG